MDVSEAHALLVARPEDEKLLKSFLLKASSFLLAPDTSGCVLHHDQLPDISVELLYMFLFPDLPIDALLNKMAAQLTICFDCCAIYHDAKVILRQKRAQSNNKATLDEFFAAMEQWDVRRQSASLSMFLEEFCTNPEMAITDFRKSRKRVRCTIAEIWRYPGTLQDRQLDSLWTEALKIILHHSGPKGMVLTEAVVDAGGLIAVGHADQQIRTWARRAVRGSSSRLTMELISVEDILELATGYLLLLDPERRAEAPLYNFTDLDEELWRAFATVCYTMDNPSEIIPFLEQISGVDLGRLILARLPSANEDFWDVMWMFCTRFNPELVANSNAEDRIATFNAIIFHKSFKECVRSEKLFPKFQMTLKWLIPYLLASATGLDNSAGQMLSTILDDAEDWCPTATKRLLRWIGTGFQSSLPVECGLLVERTLVSLPDFMFRLKNVDGTYDSEKWLDAVFCLHGGLKTVLHWAPTGDHNVITALIEQSLGVARLALTQLEPEIIKAGDPLTNMLADIVRCFYCKDAEIQNTAFDLCRDIIPLLAQEKVTIDTGTTTRLWKLCSGEHASLLEAEQKEDMKQWLPRTTHSAVPSAPLIELSIQNESRKPSPASGATPEETIANGSVMRVADRCLSTATTDSGAATNGVDPRERTTSNESAQKKQNLITSYTSSPTMSVWEQLAVDAKAQSAPGFAISSKQRVDGKLKKKDERSNNKEPSRLQTIRNEVARSNSGDSVNTRKRRQDQLRDLVPAPAAKRLPQRLPQLPEQSENLPGVTVISRDDLSRSAFSNPCVPKAAPRLKPRPTSVQRRPVPIRAPGAAPPKPLRDMKQLLRRVLSWTLSMRGDRPPGDLKFVPIPKTFQTGQDYAATFEPLLVLECWEQFQQAKEEISYNKATRVLIKSVTKVDDFHDLTVSLKSDPRELGLAENDVLYMEEGNPSRRGEPKSFLAKVNSLMVRRDGSTLVARAYLADRPDVAPFLRDGSQWRVTRVFSMTTVMREYGSICSLPLYELEKHILHGRATIPTSSTPKAIERTGMNPSQMAAVTAACEDRTGFTLIQGPPGTGKTKTILGLTGALLTAKGTAIRVPGQPSVATTSRINRLLCCAPSNAAIDEIIRRLKEGLQRPNGETFIPKVIRIGMSDSIHATVRDVTLDFLIDEAMRANPQTQGENIEGKWQREAANLRAERDSLRASEKDADVDAGRAEEIAQKISRVTSRLKQVQLSLNKAKADRTTANLARDAFRRSTRKRLLAEADVVCSTLSGAAHEVLQEISFTTVIIDEACQSVELSTLIPLRYAKRCILVGDPQQLPPTILSRDAERHRYDRSLFQRIMENNPAGVHLLDTQYRMHPEISRFPGQRFYGGRLRDASDMRRLCEAPWHSDWRFPPYALLDVRGEEAMGKNRSYVNAQEARFCVDLVRQLRSAFPRYDFAGKIGIITFYKGQSRRITDLLREQGGSEELKRIDVNTVDAFQGQEKEVIILSCVRTGNRVGFLSDERRINVALTRAKCSLFVVGSVGTLRHAPVWDDLVKDAVARNVVRDV